MKTHSPLHFAAAFGLALLLGPAATAADRVSDIASRDAGSLQVYVNVPPSWRPMFEERVGEAFVDHLRDVFRRRGFAGEIVELDRFDEPKPGTALLVVNLTEWRMSHTGHIECTFTANLQTPDATRHLGIFSGIALQWMSTPGRFGLAEAFGNAAEDALRQLHESIAETELVPGLRRR